MSDKLNDVIGEYLEKYSLEIHVKYQIEKDGEDPNQCGICILPVFVKDRKLAGDSGNFSMHSVVLPIMKQLYEDFWSPIVGVTSLCWRILPDFSALREMKCVSTKQSSYEKLAQFHAISAVYLKKHSVNGIISQTPPLLAEDGIEKRMQAAIKAVEDYWPEFKESAVKMRLSAETFRQRITDLLDKKRHFKVIALGDLSLQNMMFDDKCGPDFVFKNFESCFVGSCGYDLNFFFNACLNMNELALHRYNLLRTYYENLSESLQFFDDCDAADIPSWQTILDEVRDFEFFGFYVLLCEMPFVMKKTIFEKGYVLKNSHAEAISFEEDYKRVMQKDDIQELLKYGIDRFNYLRLWDDNTNDSVVKKEEQEDAYGFVMLGRKAFTK